MAVQSATGDWSSHGDGKAAGGSALCTPEGRTVYCLVDHDYHDCRGGQVPCCGDGSNPFHRHHHVDDGAQDSVVCSPTSASADSLEAKERGYLLLDFALGQAPSEDQFVEHKEAFEAVLQAHFAYSGVHIEWVNSPFGWSLAFGDGRRLQARQLEGAEMDHFQAAFVGYGGRAVALGSSDALRIRLNSKFAEVGAGLEVLAATVKWHEAGSSSCMLFYIVMGSLALLLVAAVSGALCFRMRRSRPAKAGSEASTNQVAASGDPVHGLGGPEKAEMDGKDLEKDQFQDLEVRSISTGEPTDNLGGAVDNGSSEEGNNSGDSEAGIGKQPAQEVSNAVV